jgi:uncharacterized cofD-like protein
LLVQGISSAIKSARAPLIYALNLMTKYGETAGYSASHHVTRIVEYGGRLPDAVLYHDAGIPKELADRYEAEEAHPVHVDTERLGEMGVKVLRGANVMSASSLVRHSPTSIARELIALFEQFGARGLDRHPKIL